MVFKCCVPGCSSTTRKSHCFPNNLALLKQWCININRHDLLERDFHAVRRNFRVCDDHFDESAKFVNVSNRSNLKQGVLPTLYLPVDVVEHASESPKDIEEREYQPPIVDVESTASDMPILKRKFDESDLEPQPGTSKDTIIIPMKKARTSSKKHLTFDCPAEERKLVIVEAQSENESESDATVVELSTNYAATTSNFEEDKAKLLKKLAQLSQRVALMTHPSELDVVNECIAQIEPTLAALNSSGRAE